MSKLADKIRKAARLDAQPLGFVTARSAKAATMLLGGVAADARAAAGLANHGADFVILTKAAASDAASTDGAIAGAVIEGDADAKAYKEGGFDFVVFDPDRTSSTSVLEEEIGYVMIVPKDASDTDLRSVEAFQLDAIHVGEIKGPVATKLFGQLEAVPRRDRIGRVLRRGSRRRDSDTLVMTDPSRTSRPWRIDQTRDPLLKEPSTPLRHPFLVQRDLLGDIARHHPLGRQEHHPGPTNHLLRTGMGPNHPLQLATFLVGQHDRIGSPHGNKLHACNFRSRALVARR